MDADRDTTPLSEDLLRAAGEPDSGAPPPVRIIPLDGLSPPGTPAPGEGGPGGSGETRGAEADSEAAGGGEGEAEGGVAAPGWLADAPFWATSAVMHLLLLFLLLTFGLERRKEPPPPSAVQVRSLRRLPPYDPVPERDAVRKPALLSPKEIPRPVVRRKLEEVTPEIPRGTDPGNFADIELSSFSVNDAFGLSGAAAGAYGERWGKGSLEREGGSAATEDAVRAALEWLLRHQHPDGGWRARDFGRRCKRRCRNLDGGDDRGEAAYDVGVTGLAMLAFTGYGQTHRFGSDPRYVDCLRRASEYLKRVQVQSRDPRARGRYGDDAGHWVYNHAIATMAMAELLVLSGDVIGLKRSVRAAVEHIFFIRNPGRAWRYGIRDGQNDLSVTGWMVLALKTARAAPLSIPDSRYEEVFRDVLRFIDDLTDERGIAGYTARGRERTSVPCMTSVGVLSRLFAGEPRSSRPVRLGVDACLAHLPRWERGNRKNVNLYYWYYASYAIFQYGGEPWRRWNPAMQKALLSAQRRGGDEDGSWDPVGHWGPRGGRVYSTALGAMTLEVYYRFRRVREGLGFLEE